MKNRFAYQDLITYAVRLVVWGVLTVGLFLSTVFRTVPGMSLAQSKWLLWGICMVCLGTGYLLTPKRRYSGATVFATVCAPLGIYVLLSYFALYRTAFTVALILIGAVLMLYICLVVAVNLQDFRAGRYRGRLAGFFLAFAYRSRMIVGVGLSVIFLVFYVNLFMGGPLMEPVTVATDPKVTDEKIADNMDTLLLLWDEKWEKLSAQERLNVLQTVANIEATYLGLPHELNVVVETLNEEVGGHYNDNTHTIAINADYIMEGTSVELVKTLTHEAYHAYENRLVDLYKRVDDQERKLLIFDDIEEYRKNFESYISGEVDLEGYAQQKIEQDSRFYSYRATEDYFEAIAKHLNPAG